MEKETLIQNLKAKVGETDFAVLSQRTVDSIVEPLLPMFAEDEKVTDETYALPVNMLKSYIGQYRHDLAEGMKSGKTTWETEQKSIQKKAIEDALAAAKVEWEKGVKPVEKPIEKPAEPDIDKKIEDKFNLLLDSLTGKEGAIGKLSDTVNTFISGFEQRRKEDVVNRIRESLKSYLLDERLADREPVVNLAIKEMTIDEKSDLDALKVEVEKKYEQLYKDFYGDVNGSPYAGGAGGGQDSNKAFEDFIKERQAQAEREAKDADALSKLMM